MGDNDKMIPGIFMPPGLAPRPAVQPVSPPAPGGPPGMPMMPPGVASPLAAPPPPAPPAVSVPQRAITAPVNMGEPETVTRALKKPSGRVVVFTGPKEGVGKSTLVLNLALAWAGTGDRNVIIVHMDPLCRNELSFMLNLQPPTLASLAQLVGKDAAMLGKLLKGRVPISQWGVGVLPLGNSRTEAVNVTPEITIPILEALSESYDIFIDVDPFFPMQVFAFDIADLVFWTCLPQRSHFEATYNTFQELKTLLFALEKFEIIINEANLPGALAPKEVERFFQTMGKSVLSYMPWEDLLPEFANTAKVLVVEQPHSEWVKALRPLLGRIQDLVLEPKEWVCDAVDQIEVGFGIGASSAGEGFSANGSTALVPSGEKGVGKGKKKGDVPSFWDELKGKMHKNVVRGMETERIRVNDGASGDDETREKVAGIIENLLQKEMNLPLTRDQRSQFVIELIDEILGLGPLEVLMRDESVNEIMVNGKDRVFIESKGKLVLTKLRFRDDEQIVQVIKRIVAPIGRRIDESVPLVDARLKDGSRVNAIIAPLAVSGPTITIRRFSSKPFVGSTLVKMGSISPELLEFMGQCIIIRKSVIISGGTGTGKTTFLNLLSSYIPEGERIITVEDTAELKLIQEHWVRLESRPPNVEGKGAITIRDLVKNCLRMRPDRIVVGECRGAEALDMLQAMNTGHEGSMATIHANTPRDALTRLEAMCMMASSELPIWAVREMVTSAVQLIVQLTRFPDGKRRVTYVTELTGRDGNTVLSQNIFRFCQTGVDENGTSVGFFSGCGAPPKFMEEFKLAGIEVPLTLFHKKEGYDEAMRRYGGK